MTAPPRHFIALFGTTEVRRSTDSVLREVITSFTAGFRLHVAAELDAAFVLNWMLDSAARCRATDVERTHRQLCTSSPMDVPR